MNKSMRNIMVRVITKRMQSGETFDEVIKSYPKLTEEEIEELRYEIFG